MVSKIKRTDLLDPPIEAEEAFHTEYLDRDVLAPAKHFHVTLPGLMPCFGHVNRPAHQRKDELNVRIKSGDVRKLGS